MPSVYDQLYGDHSAAVRLRYEGESLTRYASGDTSSDESISGIWTEHEPQREEGRGAEAVRTGELEVASSQTVAVADTWLIRSELWQTLAIKGIAGGLRKLSLQRNDIEHTGRAGGGLR